MDMFGTTLERQRNAIGIETGHSSGSSFRDYYDGTAVLIKTSAISVPLGLARSALI